MLNMRKKCAWSRLTCLLLLPHVAKLTVSATVDWCGGYPTFSITVGSKSRLSPVSNAHISMHRGIKPKALAVTFFSVSWRTQIRARQARGKECRDGSQRRKPASKRGMRHNGLLNSFSLVRAKLIVALLDSLPGVKNWVNAFYNCPCHTQPGSVRATEWDVSAFSRLHRVTRALSTDLRLTRSHQIPPSRFLHNRPSLNSPGFDIPQCEICERILGNDRAVDQHSRAKHPRCYCTRCMGTALSISAREETACCWLFRAQYFARSDPTSPTSPRLKN